LVDGEPDLLAGDHVACDQMVRDQLLGNVVGHARHGSARAAGTQVGAAGRRYRFASAPACQRCLSASVTSTICAPGWVTRMWLPNGSRSAQSMPYGCS